MRLFYQNLKTTSTYFYCSIKIEKTDRLLTLLLFTHSCTLNPYYPMLFIIRPWSLRASHVMSFSYDV